MLWGLIGLSTIIGPIGIWLLRGWIQKKDDPAAEKTAQAA